MTLLYHDEKLRQCQHEAYEAVHAVKGVRVKVIDCQPTGSAYYGRQNPADFDCIMLLDIQQGDFADLWDGLDSAGWIGCGVEGNTSGGDTDEADFGVTWVAVRRGQMNAILTTDKAFYYRHFAASTMVRAISAEHQCVPEKREIISLFQWVRDGELSKLYGEE